MADRGDLECAQGVTDELAFEHLGIPGIEALLCAEFITLTRDMTAFGSPNHLVGVAGLASAPRRRRRRASAERALGSRRNHRRHSHASFICLDRESELAFNREMEQLNARDQPVPRIAKCVGPQGGSRPMCGRPLSEVW